MEFGRLPQIPGGRENAERAAASRQVPVDPVRGLARGADDAEHVAGREVEDRQSVENLAAGDAHAVVAPPGDPFGARGALVGTDAEAVLGHVPGEHYACGSHRRHIGRVQSVVATLWHRRLL